MKISILCIDDSKAIHAFLKDCLKDVIKDFSSVYDGVQGVKAVEDNLNNYDCIFLDWEMPNKTGPEVLLDLKKIGNKTPVIMLTSKNQIEDISGMMSLGAAEYVMKPFTKDIVIEKLEMVINKKN